MQEEYADDGSLTVYVVYGQSIRCILIVWVLWTCYVIRDFSANSRHIFCRSYEHCIWFVQ